MFGPATRPAIQLVQEQLVVWKSNGIQPKVVPPSELALRKTNAIGRPCFSSVASAKTNIFAH
jgi:hypothetical protein